MSRSVLTHAALLAGLLVAAYFVWNREPSTETQDIPVLSLRGGLDRALYKAEDRIVDIQRKKDKQGSYYWLTVTTWEQPPPEPPKPAPPASQPTPPEGDSKPGDKKAGPANKPEPAIKPEPDKKAEPPKEPKKPKKPKKIKKVQQFKGSQATEQLMKDLATLSALRSLGTVSKDKLKAFGLARPKKSLAVTGGGATRKFSIGDNTYGNMDSYLMDNQDRRVFVVRPQPIGDLPYAEFRLMDRDLMSFKLDEVERVVVTQAGASKTLVHQNRRTPPKAYWATESNPGTKKALFDNWMDKLNRLGVLEYVPRDKAPRGLQEKLAVTFHDGGKQLDRLVLYAEPGPPVAVTPSAGSKKPPGGELYARTESSRGLVKVRKILAEELVRDAASILKEK